LPEQPEAKQPPIYRQIAAELRSDIQSGLYRPGQRIPGENKLMEQWGVSRNTARDALAVLREEGLTDTRRGAGVFVRKFNLIPRNAAERLSRKHWGAGRSMWDADLQGRPHAEGVDIRELEAPERIAGPLGVPIGSPVLCRSRVHRVEGRPVQTSASYLPAGLVAGSRIAEQDTGPGGIYARLEELGRAPERFREEVRARMPLGEEAKTLKLASGTPVIHIVRVAFDADGVPVEVNEMLLDANSYLLQYDFTS